MHSRSSCTCRGAYNADDDSSEARHHEKRTARWTMARRSESRRGQALYDLLMLDRVAQNGGLLHSVQMLEPSALTAAVAGYGWFGLDALTDGIEWVATGRPASLSKISRRCPPKRH